MKDTNADSIPFDFLDLYITVNIFPEKSVLFRQLGIQLGRTTVFSELCHC